MFGCSQSCHFSAPPAVVIRLADAKVEQLQQVADYAYCVRSISATYKPIKVTCVDYIIEKHKAYLAKKAADEDYSDEEYDDVRAPGRPRTAPPPRLVLHCAIIVCVRFRVCAT